MRDILFRGKRLDNGEWVEGDLVHSFYKVGDACVGKFCCTLGMHQVDPSTVGKYTGLKDKSGKRIFEGDIIKRFWLGAEIIYCVRYDAENARFIGKALNKNGFTSFDGDGEMFEVIGNINDNPEMLKGGEV